MRASTKFKRPLHICCFVIACAAPFKAPSPPWRGIACRNIWITYKVEQAVKEQIKGGYITVDRCWRNFYEIQFPLNIYCRDRAGVLNDYEFISKLLPFVLSPECNKSVFYNEIYPSGFRNFVNLILLFISFLFSYPCALDVSVPPPPPTPPASLMLHATVVKFLQMLGGTSM
jgi:hypothetical protein